ncbi:MAG TPA: ThiF family adenylyltransferase, partial [Candidatus Acidoferrum sp.]|nr:ThiF family adenylyltransferase [Candidatus Acidoferrum sp.]
MLARWYQLDEARLIAEEEQLKKAGFQLDRDALRSRSRVEFTGSINDSKQDVAIRIICSEGFPYRIPTFVAPNLKLNPETRHISFRTHSICLRQAVPNGWDFEDHIVDLIDDARRVLVGQHTGDFGEEHTAPDQDLFGTQSAKWRIIIPEDLNSLPRENYLKCEARCLYQTKKHVLLLTKAGNRESAIEAPSDSQPIKMDLFRLSEIPIEFVRQFDDTFTAQRNIDILSQIQRNAAEGAEISRLRYILSKIKRHPLVVGIVFPFQNGRLVWQFFRVSAQGSRLEQEAFASHQLSDLSVRLSQSLNLAELFKARILIIGAGAIGSTIAVELACAGVGHIEICDFDHVTIGNIPRHEVSLAALGLPKVEAVKARILSKNPHTGVTAAQINILEDPQFEERVRMATVVVVSIGDENIERYINRVCVPENKPTVYAYAGLHASVGHIIRTLP